jgi:TPR repeat protein
LGIPIKRQRGVEVDDVKARYWYTKAAKLGLAPAQLALGKLYDKGEGVAKDLAALVKFCLTCRLE